MATKYNNKLEANYVYCGLLKFSSIGEASPRQGKDPNSIFDPGHFSRCRYFIIQFSTEFSEADMVEENNSFLLFPMMLPVI